MSNPFTHVKYLWKDEEAAKLTPAQRLHYRSNRLGDDLTLTNTGGGNTSSKVMEKDPLTGKPVEWIQESGAPRGDRYFAIYNPPVVNRQLGIRKSALGWNRLDTPQAIVS